MDAHTFLIQLLNRSSNGAAAAFLCAPPYAVLRDHGIINLAHGSFYMLGAISHGRFRIAMGSLWLAIPPSLALSVLFGSPSNGC